MNSCSICGSSVVSAYGNVESDILIAGEIPSEIDLQREVPFVGEAGEILSYELMNAGLDLWGCRLTLLWQHIPNKNPECFEQSMKSLLLEMAGRKCLLLGSEFAKFFLNDNISNWSGLVVTSPMFPRSTKFVMVGVSPSVVLHQPMGSVRDYCTKFVKLVKSYKEVIVE